MNNNTEAPSSSSESTDEQLNQRPFDETLTETTTPPLLSPENHDVAQRAWNDGVIGSIRAPPMLVPMAGSANSQPANQVLVEKVPNGVSVTSVKMECARKKPKRMTPRRREIITGFLLEVHANPGKYGKVGGPTWTNELLLRIRGESGRFDYVQVTDVITWLHTAEFKEEYENLLRLQKGFQGTPSSAPSASARPLQSAKPIRPKEPVRLAPPLLQPAPFATVTASSTAAQVKNAQPESVSSNLKGIVGDDGIVYQTQLPQHSSYFVNHMGLPILPDDLWQHTKEVNRQQVQPELFFQPGGILVQLPPSATATTLYIHPTSWAAYVGKCNENGGGGATGPNEEVKLETVKKENVQAQELKREEEDNGGSDFSGDQFMGYMGEPTDAQE